MILNFEDINMEIVFVWINNFRNLKNVSFNLGSEYVFALNIDAKNKQCNISRNKNEKYIADLFSPFLNVSAIVGENASGKSSTIEALRQILCPEQRDNIEYFVIFREGNNYFYDHFLEYSKYKPTKVDKLFEEGLDFSDRQVETKYKIISNFNLTSLYDAQASKKQLIKRITGQFDNEDSDNENIKSWQTIFFSQIIDLNIFPMNHDAELGIDISSNWLLFDDLEHKPDDSTQYNLSFHKYGETMRQVIFALQYAKKDILQGINVPTEIDIVSHPLSYILETSSDGFWNTPSQLRPFAKLLLDKLQNEINESHKIDTIENSNTRKVLEVLKDIINCLYKNLEISNLYLNYDFNIKPANEIESILSAKNAVIQFFRGQDLFDGQPAIDLINCIEESINTSLKADTHGVIVWSTKISEKTKELLEKYKNFIASLNQFSSYRSPYGFMSFDWRNMSTGEKAFFNLFARFYYAKNKIEEQIKYQIKSVGQKPKKLPETIYILIDEGEIGFHLQWQKEYIQKLITVLPEILKFDNQKVKLQIIFTTHSPMSLSDIPNDHILYLRNGQVIDNKEIESFGANISDLLSQSFFIHDGLMGNFAKLKINETIKWLNDKKETNNAEYHKSLIQNIGEPIVQRKLTEMYAEKMKDDTAKDALKNEILAMQEKYKTQYGEEI
ncbi:hypothetical protein FACS189411_05300 [Bacteroidia bacterium]|nr:hypothetical protein FACS189411_05300 [Bacteroidia bacterium]